MARSKEEHINQVALFQWWSLYAPTKGLETCLMFAVPNGGSRNVIEAANLKREGVTAGVSDIFVLVPRGGFHGLAIEMKSSRGRVRDEQVNFMLAIGEQGYMAEVCRSFEEACNCIENYIEKG